MALDVELYRRTVFAPAGKGEPGRPPPLRRISVIDIQPEGAAQTLVLVHGYAGRLLQWLPQLRYFGQYMRVVAPDLRGHGLSTDDPDEPPLNLESLVDDLELVVERLGVRRPFILGAHSFGGLITVEYAIRHPEDVSHQVLIAVPSQFVRRPGARFLMNLPGAIFDGTARRLDFALYAPVRTLRRMYDGGSTGWRGSERLPLLRVPTLLILGQRDTVFVRENYADVARLIPGAKQVVIPVSAHHAQLERPDATNRAIRRFVEPHAPVAPDRPVIGGGAPAPGARYAERPWLLHYDDQVPEELPVPRLLVSDLLGNAARYFPERPAIVFFGQKIGYRELDLLSNRFAHALRKLGVERGERVAIVLPNVPQCVVGFYGTLKAGAVVVMGSPLTSEAEIAAQLRDSGARVLLTLAAYRALAERACAGAQVRQIVYTEAREYLPLVERVRLASLIADGLAPAAKDAAGTPRDGDAATAAAPPAAAQRPRAPGELPAPLAAAGAPTGAAAIQRYAFQELLRSQPSAQIDPGVAPDDLALLQYTSGTVDPPKGVMLSHSNLAVNVAQVRHWLVDARRGGEVLLCALPLAHSYGITAGMNLAMALGASLVLLPTTRTKQLLRAIRQHRPSLFPGIPALYLAIANEPHVRRYGVSSIRVCISGSAPLPVEVQEAFEKLTRGRLVEGYGLTEAGPVTHTNPLSGERRIGRIGLPVPSTDARIVDTTTGAPLAPGAVGELLIRGPQVMGGYWNLPADTAQTLRDGWLHTGDLATMDEDGFFTIVDRKKDVILAGAYNVYPRDVEEVLYEHPKVLEAAVVGEPDPAGGQSPLIKAVVVLKRGERATAEELLALCRERLDAYKVPKVIEFRTELPKNFVGKVLRRLLVDG